MFDPEVAANRGFAAHPPTIHQTASDIAGLASLVKSAETSAAKAERLAAREDEWGFFTWFPELNPLPDIRRQFADLRENLKLIADGIADATRKLFATAATYSDADQILSQFLGETNAVAQRNAAKSDLNPVSEFYQNHRTLYGTALALPQPLGRVASFIMDGRRFSFNITSDDKMNVIQDTLNFANNFFGAAFQTMELKSQWRGDPLGFSLDKGVWFLLNHNLWAKDTVDHVSGDPLATGQSAYVTSRVGKGLHDIAGFLTTALNNLRKTWAGEASERARDQITAFRDGILHTGDNAYQLASLLQHHAAYMTILENILRYFLCEIVLSVAVTSLAWLMTKNRRVLPILATNVFSRALFQTAHIVRPAFLMLKKALAALGKTKPLRPFSPEKFGKHPLSPQTLGTKFMSAEGKGGKAAAGWLEDRSRGRQHEGRHSLQTVSPRDVAYSWMWRTGIRGSGNNVLGSFGMALWSARPNNARIRKKYGDDLSYPAGKLHLPARWQTDTHTRIGPWRKTFEGLPWQPPRPRIDLVNYFQMSTQVSLMTYGFVRSGYYGSGTVATPNAQVKQQLTAVA